LRTIVERVAVGVCDDCGWQPFVAHARSNHTHSVVAADCVAEAVALSLKSWITRRLVDARELRPNTPL
jgi:hypothetical protein